LTTPLGSTPVASTVFLRVNSSDKLLQLSWTASTPWDNFSYTVLRKNASGAFDSIATVTTTNYVDRNLVNGTEYCYKIRAFGSYGISGVPNPLRNHSQEACNRPQDNVPPCAPRLAVSTICNRPVDCNDPRQVFNTLTWNRPTETCPDATDLAGYNVYYSPSANEPNFTRIQRITSPGTLRLETKPENGIAGCYAVTAFDQLNNESARSNIVCVENCPSYSLPNTFTPNGDGQNELFKPYPFCFIQSIDLKIVNRWGQVVFKTADPNINWDGNNLQGEPLPAGTYYYVCQVFEQRSTGVVPLEKPLEGFIQLVK
jgi:gliding motility-associated-like protein